jgi:hypothetical protein
MKTRPGSMAWHNASTLPINWRGASPARPIPNWRSKPPAVAPVDDIDWVWIPAYGQKIDPGSNSQFGRENSLFGKNNSLFHLLGNFATSI